MTDLGPTTLDRLTDLTVSVEAASGLATFDLADVRLGSPIARPHKVLGIGLNYADHATESGADVPLEPVVFPKATSSLSGPYDDIVVPPVPPRSTGRLRWAW